MELLSKIYLMDVPLTTNEREGKGGIEMQSYVTMFWTLKYIIYKYKHIHRMYTPTNLHDKISIQV